MTDEADNSVAIYYHDEVAATDPEIKWVRYSDYKLLQECTRPNKERARVVAERITADLGYHGGWQSQQALTTAIESALNDVSPTSTAPVVDANEIVRQIRDKLVNGNPAALIEDIAKLVEPKQEGESKCEHGVPWSMECLSCGHSDYVAAAAATTTPVEQSAIDLDPLEFWCDLVEVLGHPRPVKVNPVSVIAEVEERLR